MQNIREWIRLVEAFDNPQPYNWAVRSRQNWSADFKVGKLSYRVLFSHRRHEIEDDMWEVQFAQVHKSWFNPTVYKTELTKSGNSFTIFSTVLACIREFLYQKHPHTLFFTGLGDSRQSLYLRLCKTLAANYGYQFETTQDPINDGRILYVLIAN